MKTKSYPVLLAIVLLLASLILPACQTATPTPAPTPTTPAPAATAPASATKAPTSSSPAPTSVSVPTAKPNPIVLKCVSHPGLVGPTPKGLYYFIDKVKELSKGELTINLLGGSEVIPSPDLAPAVKSGVVDLAFISGSYYPGEVPEGMALAFSQILPWEEQQTGFWDLIVESNKKAGFLPLGRASVFQNCFLLYTKFPLSKPQELSGHKFRGVSPYIYFQKALGIVSVSISNTEAYGALQQGLIDGVTWKEEAVISYKLNEVGVKYVIDYPYAQDDLVFLMSVTGFNRLPQNLQKVLTDSARATERANYEMWNSQAADWRQTLLKLGFTVVKFSPEDAKWYTDLAYSSGWAAVLEKNPVTGPKLKELSLKK